jgi:hypothetical protein
VVLDLVIEVEVSNNELVDATEDEPTPELLGTGSGVGVGVSVH